jgi:glutamine synthetase
MSSKPKSEKIDELVEHWKRRLDPYNKVKLAGIDADGVLRGKVVSKDKLLSAIKSDGLGWCSVIFGWV